jgi:hypothetical protein
VGTCDKFGETSFVRVCTVALVVFDTITDARKAATKHVQMIMMVMIYRLFYECLELDVSHLVKNID